MTTPTDLRSPDCTGWAARRLNVAPGASALEVRRKFLRRLADADFVPAPGLCPAFAVLQRAHDPLSIPVQAAVWTEEQARLRRDVEAFTERFFDLPPAQRSEAWKNLSPQCRFAPPLRGWLEALGPAVATPIALPPDASADGQRLAADLAAVFVLPHAEHARRRRDLRNEWGDNVAAVRELRRLDHPLARWEADTLRAIEVHPLIRGAKAETIIVSAAPASFTCSQTVLIPNRQAAPSSDANTWLSGRVVVAIIFVLLGVFRGCMGAVSRDDGRQPQKPNWQTMPPVPTVRMPEGDWRDRDAKYIEEILKKARPPAVRSLDPLRPDGTKAYGPAEPMPPATPRRPSERTDPADKNKTNP